MEDLKIELALEIMQLKIVHYIKDYRGDNKNEFIKNIKKLTKERDLIYEMDPSIIDKVYNIYLEEVKSRNEKKK